jgi:hypothetical protein
MSCPSWPRRTRRRHRHGAPEHLTQDRSLLAGIDADDAQGDLGTSDPLHSHLLHRGWNLPSTGCHQQVLAGDRFPHEGTVTPARLGEYDLVAAIKASESIRCPASPRRSLVLSGPLGVGKTGMLTPVLQHYLGQGQPALWIEFYDFCLEMQSGYKDGTASDKPVAARRAPLILLGDVGDVERREPESDDKRRILWSVLNARHGEDLPTLVTTNLDERDFRRQFGGRMSDRLWEMAFVVPVGGVNLRRVEV